MAFPIPDEPVNYGTEENPEFTPPPASEDRIPILPTTTPPNPNQYPTHNLTSSINEDRIPVEPLILALTQNAIAPIPTDHNDFTPEIVSNVMGGYKRLMGIAANELRHLSSELAAVAPVNHGPTHTEYSIEVVQTNENIVLVLEKVTRVVGMRSSVLAADELAKELAAAPFGA